MEAVKSIAPAALLFLAACGEAPPPAEEPVVEVESPKIEIDPEVQAESYEHFDQFRALTNRVEVLEAQIAEDLLSWESYRFEDYLDLDPWDLAADQVYFLKYFCEGGQILLKEQTTVLLLEREIDRRRREALGYGADTEAGETARHRLNARLEKATGKLEQRILDLEKVATMSGTMTQNEIELPGDVGDDELEAARRYVEDRQKTLVAEKKRLASRMEELEVFLAQLDASDLTDD